MLVVFGVCNRRKGFALLWVLLRDIFSFRGGKDLWRGEHLWTADTGFPIDPKALLDGLLYFASYFVDIRIKLHCTLLMGSLMQCVGNGASHFCIRASFLLGAIYASCHSVKVSDNYLFLEFNSSLP